MRVLIALISLLLFQCIANQGGNPTASGLTITYNGGTSSFSSSGYDPKDSQGEACTRSFLGAVAIGDASIAKAASKAQLRTIRSVSQEFSNLGAIVYSVCTIVRGQK